MTTSSTDIAIIGGGASGVLLAAQLLRRNDVVRVVLVERGAEAGPGLAYATPCPAHLLNTRAGDMSAFPDEPDHFVRWLAENGQVADPHGFAPRGAYGDYLRCVLASAGQASGARLTVVRGEAISVSQDAGGVRLGMAGGQPIACRSLVLATGHRPPSSDHGAWRGNPWAPNLLDELDPFASVLLVGTGLTMIDIVASLMQRKHLGPILAVSRRGLVPRPHAERPGAAPNCDTGPLFTGPLSSRLRRFRNVAETAGGWGGVMQALRPHNAELWHGLNEAERRRFLRHLRPWWDVHRHRVAPEAFALLQDTIASGQMSVVAGRVQVVDQADERVCAAITRRGRSPPETHVFHRVIDCRGTMNNIDGAMPLHAQMLVQGLLCPDALDLGVSVDEDDAILTKVGIAFSRIHALGPPTRGRHWEITAIPDIRRRAALLADRLLGQLAT